MDCPANVSPAQDLTPQHGPIQCVSPTQDLTPRGVAPANVSLAQDLTPQGSSGQCVSNTGPDSPGQSRPMCLQHRTWLPRVVPPNMCLQHRIWPPRVVPNQHIWTLTQVCRVGGRQKLILVTAHTRRSLPRGCYSLQPRRLAVGTRMVSTIRQAAEAPLNGP